jgi:hypothetical protein
LNASIILSPLSKAGECCGKATMLRIALSAQNVLMFAYRASRDLSNSFKPTEGRSSPGPILSLHPSDGPPRILRANNEYRSNLRIVIFRSRAPISVTSTLRESCLRLTTSDRGATYGNLQKIRKLPGPTPGSGYGRQLSLHKLLRVPCSRFVLLNEGPSDDIGLCV